MAEEGSGSSIPWNIGELVDSGDHESRKTAINLLIDDHDRQPVDTGKCAIDFVAAYVQPLRRRSRGMKVKAVFPEGGAAPWAGFQRRGRRPPASAVVSQPAGSGALVEVLPAAEIVGRRSTSDPQPNLDRPCAQPARRLALKLKGADQPGGALELVEREQAQGVAHHHREAGPVQARIVQAPPCDREG